MYGELPHQNKKKHIPNNSTESGSLNFEGGELEKPFFKDPPVFNFNVTEESKIEISHLNIRKNK